MALILLSFYIGDFRFFGSWKLIVGSFEVPKGLGFRASLWWRLGEDFGCYSGCVLLLSGALRGVVSQMMPREIFEIFPRVSKVLLDCQRPEAYFDFLGCRHCPVYCRGLNHWSYYCGSLIHKKPSYSPSKRML